MFALILFGLVLFATWPGAARQFPHVLGGFDRSPWGLLVMAVIVALPVGILHRRPIPVLALMLVESLVFAIALKDTKVAILQFLAATVAVCSVAATRSRRTSIAAAAAALGVLTMYSLTMGVAEHAAVRPASELALAMAVVVAWMVGNSIRQRRDYAERLHAQAAAQAITAERLRIARELHDMVAHSIGIIAIQAGMGSRVIDTQPAEARSALSVIEVTSRETLAGLRTMLGVLRKGESDPDPVASQRSPAPGLADVDRLAAMTADVGVRVDVSWQGDRGPLPAEIDLSAFRIIQEAVTNVVRHAGTDCCRVSVAYRYDELSIEIVDDGLGAPTGGAGYGIAGMRERVTLLHGQFSAGPRPEGGFRVAAQLPR